MLKHLNDAGAHRVYPVNQPFKDFKRDRNHPATLFTNLCLFVAKLVRVRLESRAMTAPFNAPIAPNTAPDLPCMARIIGIQRETPLVKTFEFDTDIDAQPGQFIMAWVPGVDEKPMSIAGMRPLTISVAKVGPMTTALHALKEGDFVGWRGPFGKPYTLERNRQALLVAGGYGSAPLYVLAKQALAHGMDVTVAIGARETDELLYADKFEQLGVRLLLSTNDGSRGVQGFVTHAITRVVQFQDTSQVTLYACGPEPMLVALQRLCRERLWHAQLSVERYMKCGFGICGQCALDDLLVCLDGPVMTLDQLDSKEEFGKWHRLATGRKFEI